jgi:tetratricopeptide (TPR) repeat protein
MRARWLCLPFVLTAVTFAPAAFAESKGDKKADSSASKGSKKGEKADSDGVRRDPNGVTGISPAMEAIRKGDLAYGDKEPDKAIEAYRDAINKDPKEPMGHYRLGEMLLASGKLDDANQSWQTAIKAAGTDDAARAKALFVVADLRERQGKWEEAAAAWKEYGSFVGSHPKAHGYGATSTERQKTIDTHNDVAAKAGKVKERIQQREREVQQQATTPATTKKK